MKLTTRGGYREAQVDIKRPGFCQESIIYSHSVPAPAPSPVSRCYLHTFVVSCRVLALFFYAVSSASHYANQASFAHISVAQMFLEKSINLLKMCFTVV